MASDPNGGVCLIRRVVIRNYKSIAACDVELGPLTFLVGPNGSGKSNFLDAIRFVSDALHFSLEHALRTRDGIREVLRQSRDDTEEFAVRLEFQLPTGQRGHYAFSVRAVRSSFVVHDEECFVSSDGGPEGVDHYYRVSHGSVEESSVAVEPAAIPDRLYLVALSGNAAFRPVYDALSTMGFYNLNPNVLRELQAPGPRELLTRDGSNLPGVLQNLSESKPLLKSRVEEYLSQVVPGITHVDGTTVGRRETLLFVQRLAGNSPWPFTSAQMSDGTLRALGVLVALFQGGGEEAVGPLVVGIEEPETALHPAAAAVLIDAMRDALSMRQVIVTSHSPELLDNLSIADSEILAVVADEGETRIGHLDEAGRSVLRDHLFTAGDLLRMNQLRPDLAAGRLSPEDVVLFGKRALA